VDPQNSSRSRLALIRLRESRFHILAQGPAVINGCFRGFCQFLWIPPFQPRSLLSWVGVSVFSLISSLHTWILQAVIWRQVTCWTTSRFVVGGGDYYVLHIVQTDCLAHPFSQSVVVVDSCWVWSGRNVKLITLVGLVPSLRVCFLRGAWLSLGTAVLWFQLPPSGKCRCSTSDQDRTSCIRVFSDSLFITRTRRCMDQRLTTAWW